VQKSEEKEGNKRRKKGKENIRVWEGRETGRKGKKEVAVDPDSVPPERTRVTKPESGDE